LARCFMSGSQLLLLDEPFEGVAPALVQRLVRAVRELVETEQGLSVLLCESEFKWPRMLASRIYTIERGQTEMMF
jgi:branched-chain amino acid transport system ATP-binding protein